MLENLMSRFNKLEDLKDIHIEYLKARRIDYEKVKHLLKCHDTAICCRILWFNEKNDIDWINIQSRYIDKKWSERFKTLAEHKATWLFIDKIDETKNYVILVEWMFDFLTLRQYDSNIVWLFNAWAIEPLEVLKEIMKRKSITRLYFIPDNDKAWIESEYKITQHFKNMCSMHLNDYDSSFKDVNDYVKFFWDSFEFRVLIEELERLYIQKQESKLKEIRDKQKTNSDKAKEINKAYQSGRAIEFQHDYINKEIWKLKPHNLSLIIWAPNSWKTSFCLLMMRHNLGIWNKIWFLSYEMSVWDILNQYYLWKIDWAMERLDDCTLTDSDVKKVNEYKSEILDDKWFHFVERPIEKVTFDKLVNDIEEMKSIWCDAVFVDNLVKIRWTNNEISDNQEVIQYLYEEAHKWLSIILLHHSDKSWMMKNINTVRWTWDTIIKPDDTIFLNRPWLLKKEKDQEDFTIEEKAELIIKRWKQRIGKSHAWNECRMYFFNGYYYTNWEFCNIVSKTL